MEFRPIIHTLLRNKSAPLLVAIQVAIGLAILVNALFVVGLRVAASERPSGIAHEEEVFGITATTWNKLEFKDRQAWQDASKRALAAIGGVQSVAFVNQMPMGQSGWNTTLAVDPKQTHGSALSAWYVSSDSLVNSMGLKLIEGHDFVPSDIVVESDTNADEEPKAIILTLALAKQLFPDADHFVGKNVYQRENAMRVVGVIERLQTIGADLGPQGEMSSILALRMINDQPAQFFVRAEPGQRDRVMKEAAEAMQKAAPFPVRVRVASSEQQRHNRYRGDIGLARVLSVMSIFLLLVTASGIVGMTSFWVAQRRKQIGVRRALGARKVDILRYFLTENFIISSLGIFAGLAMGVGLNQILVQTLEFPRLPIEYLIGGSLGFWLLGLLAVYGPAFRAASISPAMATRTA